jgi:hypothetical protein
MPSPDLLINQFGRFLVLCLVAYLCGLLVLHGNVRVNYTRKINHFALFFLPAYLNSLLPYSDRGIPALLWQFSFFMIFLGIYVQPIRDRVRLISIMFHSYDRPEDRPHTLLWLSTQVMAGYMVLVPLIVLLDGSGHGALVFIPILINGLGDGLAEPVGVRFARRHYATRALFTRVRYTRSYVGSACVFVSGWLAVALVHTSFSTPQFFAALLLIPIAGTLAEAFSPHTWDTPFIFLVTGGLLLVIVHLVP